MRICLFQNTRCKSPPLSVVGSNPGLQDTSFCDHLPSAAPSVHWTEGAARHSSTASNLDWWSILVTALLRRRDKVRGFWQPLFLISMRFCLDIETTFPSLFLHGRRLGRRQEEASVPHSECSNAVVNAKLQSYSFWARRNDVRGIGPHLVSHGIV